MTRLATIEDIDKLLKLRQLEQEESWKNEYIFNEKFLTRTKNYFIKHLNKDFYIFVYTIRKEIVGTCGLKINEFLPEYNDNGKHGLICNVYTKMEYRRQGIQKELIKKVIDYSKKKELRELELSTTSKEGINLYKSLGFKKNYFMYRLDLLF